MTTMRKRQTFTLIGLLFVVAVLFAPHAPAQEYSFDNPQQYVEVRNTNDISNSEYAPFTPVNGGDIDDSQYEINEWSYKTPVEEGMGEENYLIHMDTEPMTADELFENFTKETGDNYNPNHLVVKLGEGEFNPGTNAPIVSRPTRFIGTYENGEHLSELITGTGIDGLDDVEFYDLVLPGEGNILFFGEYQGNINEAKIQNCVLKAPLNYDGIDSHLIFRDNVFDFSQGNGPAARVYGDSEEVSKDTVSNVEISDNVFYGNGANVAFVIRGTGVDAGIEDGNNAFINWRAVVVFDNEDKAVDDQDFNLSGNYWEAPAAFPFPGAAPEEKEDGDYYRTQILTDPAEIIARQVEGIDPAAIVIADAVAGDPNADQDNDGLSDYDEMLHGTFPNHPDTDMDGLSDGEEVDGQGTDPMHFDTDNDGVSDGEEVAQGTDPLDPNDTPQMPLTGAWGLAALAVVLAVAGAVRRFRCFPSTVR